MTPKEKAESLVEKYENLEFDKYDDENNKANYYLSPHEAVECAKISVNEIINNSVMNYSGADVTDNEILIDREYWNEVIKEIEKL